MDAVLKELVENIQDEIIAKAKREESIISSIIQKKFGIDIKDHKSVKELIKVKKLSLLRDCNYNLIGITTNNRWLYTINGEVIGKSGRRYKIENIKS